MEGNVSHFYFIQAEKQQAEIKRLKAQEKEQQTEIKRLKVKIKELENNAILDRSDLYRIREPYWNERD